MPISVVATGGIAEVPSLVTGEHGPMAVFVLDPFPGSACVRVHSCEVRCREGRLVDAVLGHVSCGDCVVVTGELCLEHVVGPLEDDLSAVRVSIEADSVYPAKPE